MQLRLPVVASSIEQKTEVVKGLLVRTDVLVNAAETMWKESVIVHMLAAIY